jgi:hypothetical protein
MYEHWNARGITLEQGAEGKFIGLLKTVHPVHGIAFRPTATQMVPGYLPHVSAFVSSIPHADGWQPTTLPFSILSEFGARAIALSSSSNLSSNAMVELLELFVSTAGYPPAFVEQLAAK